MTNFASWPNCSKAEVLTNVLAHPGKFVGLASDADDKMGNGGCTHKRSNLDAARVSNHHQVLTNDDFALEILRYRHTPNLIR